MWKFLLQPIRAFEFTSPVFDYLKFAVLSIKPVSSIIFAHPGLRSTFTRREINERILEIPFIYSRIPFDPVRILDVGACESSVSLSLASIGHRVTALDTRKYHFPHPQLEIITGDIINHHRPNYYDLVICLSTLEHIGIEVYGNTSQIGQDERAVKKMFQNLKKGGRLLLTTPVDLVSGAVPGSRIYTVPDLKKILRNFKKIKIYYGYKNKFQNWIQADTLPSGFKSFGNTPSAVALIEAIK